MSRGDYPAGIIVLVARDYRLGYPVKRLADWYEIPEETIKRWARERGWRADLAAEVRRRARDELIIERRTVPDPDLDEHLVTQGVDRAKQVLERHRAAWEGAHALTVWQQQRVKAFLLGASDDESCIGSRESPNQAILAINRALEIATRGEAAVWGLNDKSDPGDRTYVRFED